MGSSTGKAATSSERASEGLLRNMLQTVFTETDPVRQELGSQYLEALQTGGVGAQIPLISAAQQQSRQATSRALQGVTDDLSRARLAGTPFGERVTAQTRLAGEQATGLIPSQVTSQFLQGAQGYALGTIAPSVAGYSSLSGLGAQRDIAKGSDTAKLIGSLVGAGGSAAGAVGAALAT